MNITVLGHVCIDQNTSEGVSYTSAGSPAIFISRIFNKIPHTDTHIIAPYGIDFATHAQTISLHLNKVQAMKTLMYSNQSRGNLRTQKALNREFAEPLPIDDDIIARIQMSDIIFFAPLTPSYGVDYVKSCISYAKKDALKILLPQGYYRDFTPDNDVVQRMFIEADELIPLFDFLIVSEHDHQEMLGITLRWANDIKVIMTLGDKGAMYLEKNSKFIVGTKSVPLDEIVDSVGSGDIFSAAFAYKYFITRNIHRSIEFANNVARQCLFHPATDLQFTLPA